MTLDGESAVTGRDQAASGAIGRAGPDPRQLGRGRPRAAEPDARAVRGRSSSAPPATACRSARRCGCWPAPASPATATRPPPTSTGRDRRRPLAGGNAGRPARPEGLAPRRSRAVAAGDAAALSAGRRAVASPAHAARARRLPRRRHGTRQDHPGAVAAAGAEAADGRRDERKPSLLVAPASLLANWAAEIARFAPSLKAVVAHPSATPAEKLDDRSAQTT